jgi:UDP-glucose 4-epimerase
VTEETIRTLDGQCVAVTGGTGSLGQRLVRRILSGDLGRPRKVVVFSRDEAKQHYMRLEYKHRPAATDEVIYHAADEVLDFRLGDVRDFASLCSCLYDADVVFNAAALKQVPSCEYFPYEAVLTNVVGPQNIVRAVRERRIPTRLVVGISTDKACKPVNVMGMTKALQERVLLTGNLGQTRCSFLCVRYGNVLASRGSVIPLFIEQIRGGGPVTITMPEMTRFLLSLDDAVDTVFAAVRQGSRGEIYVPQVPSARVVDVAEALIDDRPIAISFSGVRPGEKVHEVLVSEEEASRTIERGGYYVVESILPELRLEGSRPLALGDEYSSGHAPMSKVEVRRLLEKAGFLAATMSTEDAS